MWIFGVDYSLTGPSMCSISGKNFAYKNCKFTYVTAQKKSVITTNQFHGFDYPIYKNAQHRYSVLADIFVSKIPEGSKVFIEGYAFAAKGKVFHIAENTGILKDRLYQKGIECVEISPTEIKKYATGKGNANKELMAKAFESDTRVFLKDKFSQTDKQWNPSSDIIDSYYICKMGFNKLNNI